MNFRYSRAEVLAILFEANYIDKCKAKSNVHKTQKQHSICLINESEQMITHEETLLGKHGKSDQNNYNLTPNLTESIDEKEESE